MTDSMHWATVLLCADLETRRHGVDLKVVRTWLEETIPDVRAHIVPDLSYRPAKISKIMNADGAGTPSRPGKDGRDEVGGTDRLILGLSSAEYSVAEMQVQARKVGLDPLGVEVINLSAWGRERTRGAQATARAKVLLAGAVARARAFPGSRPENLKPYAPAKLSRRSLFTLPALEYRPVPSVQGNLCVAQQGCRLCVRVCPFGALESVGGLIRLDKPSCQSCGLCLTACPRNAIEFPGYAPAQLAAQIAALLDPTLGSAQPRGIMFVCRRNASALEKSTRKRSAGGRARASQTLEAGIELFPVQVPCLGMLPPTWLLACLAAGAAVVGLTACLPGCPFGQEKVIEGRVDYCRELLQTLGGSREEIELLRVADLLRQDGRELDKERKKAHPRSLGHHLFPAKSAPVCLSVGPRAAAEVVVRLRAAYGSAARPSIVHPYSPLGVVEAMDGCTGCGVCQSACPTGALALEREASGPFLTFDAVLCTACGQCLPRCPEKVLRLHRQTDLGRLSGQRVTLYRDRDMRCEACGAPIATEGMLKRMGTLLGDENAAVLGIITQYCPDCRVRLGSSEPILAQPS